MDGFPLSQVHYSLLGKIAGKLEEYSYFRMQQTCRGMAELFRNNREVKGVVKERAYLKWEEGENGLPPILSWIVIDARLRCYDIVVDPECLYGVLFNEVCAPREIKEGFEEYCLELKRRRVTCNTFDFQYRRSRITKEQTIELIKILKPFHVRMESRRSNRYQALSSYENLESVALQVSLVDGLSALQFISGIEDIYLYIENGKPYADEDLDDDDYEDEDDEEEFDKELCCRIFHGIIEYIRSIPLPRYHRFYCGLSCHDHDMPNKERVPLLNDLQPIRLSNSGRGEESYRCTVGDKQGWAIYRIEIVYRAYRARYAYRINIENSIWPSSIYRIEIEPRSRKSKISRYRPDMPKNSIRY